LAIVSLSVRCRNYYLKRAVCANLKSAAPARRRLSYIPAAFTVGARPAVLEKMPRDSTTNDRLNDTGNAGEVPTIYKISPASAWREAERQGVYKGSADDARDGYIHFSTASQVAGTARKYYFGQTRLFLIAVDADALGESLRWERSRNDELFPHLYGELDLGAVTAILDLRARSDGYHDIPELAP
jgi:uncharacterized protein (DUF952 family)